MKLFLLLGLAAVISCQDSVDQSEAVGPRVTHRVVFDIAIGGSAAGRIEMGVFGEIVPNTADNFVELASNPQGEGYKGSKFYKVVKNSLIEGGDFTKEDGTGGRSIYGKNFAAENFKLKHYGAGWLSMVDRGNHTYASEFIITGKAHHELDGKNVVFGKVLGGMNVVRSIEDVSTNSHQRPTKDVVITHSLAEAVDEPFEVSTGDATD